MTVIQFGRGVVDRYLERYDPETKQQSSMLDKMVASMSNREATKEDRALLFSEGMSPHRFLWRFISG